MRENININARFSHINSFIIKYVEKIFCVKLPRESWLEAGQHRNNPVER